METKLYIDKFKREDGYYNKDDCYYEDAESYIGTEILGFCGCGRPQTAMEYVRASLQNVSDKRNMTYDEWAAEKKKLFTSDGQEYFMWYFLDNKGLTEHGGSVPGWLTVDGEELLHDLTELGKTIEL